MILSPSSPLLAEQILVADILPSSAITNTPIGHDSLSKSAFAEFDLGNEFRTSEISPDQFASGESNLLQSGITNSAVNEITYKTSCANPGIIQLDSAHINPTETRSYKIGSSQIGTTEVGRIESGTIPVSSSTQNRITQVDFGSVEFAQIDVTQIGTMQDRSFQVHSNFQQKTIPQDNTTQIQSFEIPLYVDNSGVSRIILNSNGIGGFDKNLAKVSFPSVIASDQVIQTNNLSVGNFVIVAHDLLSSQVNNIEYRSRRVGRCPRTILYEAINSDLTSISMLMFDDSDRSFQTTISIESICSIYLLYYYLESPDRSN